MFPELDFTTAEEILPEPTLGKVFLFDFEKREYVLKDGKLVEASYEQAIQQWVSMLLITELDKYQVYEGTEFGISLSQFIGRKDIPLGTIISEVSRQIQDVVTLHPEISGAENFEINRESDYAVLTFTVITNIGVLIEGIEGKVMYDG
ncbi:DUF2634 domain-containing protein [Paenibacillus taichungensis]|uniref:DUF2634 domain-containing protein n=1 Tax=Paenibacillus taichungensis TaxID=484184 RepID=UPI002DBFDF09|nr:DUF2634 domain-containing protein [Paenibacillus taichungensis]MEC0107277.1 DUF2634 domain-containing protein [Paenibacillus taichungensis]MEC0194791.1 DUF2634 domain-containing protein [Paenibacillus taichungensis]